MLKVIATPCKAKDLKPGELFSTAGPEYWDTMSLGSVAEKMWMRTEEPSTGDGERAVYRLTIVRKLPKPRRRSPADSAKEWESDEDICENYHGGNQYSVAAAESSNWAGIRKDIFEYMKEYGPFASFEVYEAFDGKGSSISARFSDLCRHGYLVATGEERETPRGVGAGVFRVRTEDDPPPIPFSGTKRKKKE